MAGALDPYKNQYTTFTYDPYVMVAIDGLEYYRTRDTLYVTYVAGGVGDAYALTDGNLTLINGSQVDLGTVSSAVVSEGIKFFGSHYFYGLGLKTVTLNCNDALDNGNVFEGDYSAMIVDSRFQPGTYVYADGVWRELSAAAFSIIISPGGGTFGDEFGNLTPPQIRLTSTSVRSILGKVTTTQYQNEFEDMIVFTGRDNVTYYLWYYFTETVVELTVDITSMPTKLHNSIIPPSGCDEVDAWEMQAPYVYIQKDEVTEIILSRANAETIRQTIVYPSWTLVRDERVRAVLCAPGYGTIDFGVLQKVTTSYKSKLTVLPIVCYGYSGTFCIDLGVTKTIDISYVRVSPENPNNEIQDSRQWDNATWVKRLREFTDRWQMRTNGNRLYLKRPDVERLYEAENDEDPMKDFIEEIHGENCYISSAPIPYKEGTPHTIMGSISLKMGTLYPKQTPPRMVQVVYHLDYLGLNPTKTMDCYFQFPEGVLSRYPSIPSNWHLFKDSNDKYWTVVNLHKNSETGPEIQPNDFFTPNGGAIDIYAEVSAVNENNIKFIDSSTNLKLVPIEGFTKVTLTVTAIGGGGGGGGGAFFKGNYPFGPGIGAPINLTCGSAGAGGESGYRSSITKVFVMSTETSLTVSIGAGGAGGTSRERNWNESGAVGSSGNPGDPTTISLAGSKFLKVPGGRGGPGASDTQSGGTWPDNSERDGYYLGGNGGSTERDHYAVTNSLVRADTDGGDNGVNGESTNNSRGPGYGGEHQQGGWTTGKPPSYRMYYGGGGGGGNPIRLTTEINPSTNLPYQPATQRAGNGVGSNFDPETTRDGHYGGGGGGGSYYNRTLYDGGKGGDGAAFIIAVGARIEVVQ